MTITINTTHPSSEFTGYTLDAIAKVLGQYARTVGNETPHNDVSIYVPTVGPVSVRFTK